MKYTPGAALDLQTLGCGMVQGAYMYMSHKVMRLDFIEQLHCTTRPAQVNVLAIEK